MSSHTLIVPPVILRAMDVGAVLACSISGGKDSDAMTRLVSAWAFTEGWQDRLFALHMDLGRMEWQETPVQVERIARENSMPLVVVRRPQGDLVQEIEDRMEKLSGTDAPFWPSAAQRYCTADQKRSQADKVYRDVSGHAPFWPSAAQRYCTAHHKTNQADRAYRNYSLIISAEGNRAQESPKRSKDPVVSVRKQITAKPLRDLSPREAFEKWCVVNEWIDRGLSLPKEWKHYSAESRPRLALTWYAIHNFTVDDVWAACGTSADRLEQHRAIYRQAWDTSTAPWTLVRPEKIAEALAGWPCHPAYVYGNERVSCALCVLATKGDLANGARHQPDLFFHLLDLEVRGGSTFKNGWSLGQLLESQSEPDTDVERPQQLTLI
jgi:3'-phosphoadenosine 5'-phosphosulfate sulfotransferase (PAPS reductase)/FAD synthetase